MEPFGAVGGPMDPHLERAARDAPGFMPHEEGLALYRAALAAPPDRPLLEIGSYCGKSTVYLGAAARVRGSLVFSIDHHRGSEEHQPGEGYHDPALVDERGRVDTLPAFRRTIAAAGLEDVVVGIVGRSADVARPWETPLGLVFIDGGHSQAAADHDLDGWTPHLVPGGLLVIHDVFFDPEKGGAPPRNIYLRALNSGRFEEVAVEGSLRVLRRLFDAT